jgi:thiol-disulfide isomerase/thioredoxin
MSARRPPGRRAVLRAAGVAVGLGALAACADGDRPGGSDDGVESGFVDGDGGVSEWAPADRGEPVELAGVTMEGDPVDIDDWRGGPVVLNFWYAECPPCRAEAPALVAVATELEPDGVRFLGVNHTNEPATALAFERRFEIPYPSLDDHDSAGVAALQGVVPLNAMPSTVVLDAEGRVAARVVGMVEESTLRALLTTVLDET